MIKDKCLLKSTKILPEEYYDDEEPESYIPDIKDEDDMEQIPEEYYDDEE